MDPPLRDAFLASGRLALDKHDFALAADTFRAGLSKYPDDPDLHAGLAQAFQSSDREQMLEEIKSALAINPRHIPSLLLLADHLIDAEDYAEAEKQLAAVLRVNPNRPEALAYRAVLAHLRNDTAQERELRAAALNYWKTNPQVDHLIGLKLSLKYRFAEGAAAQRRALAFEPGYLPARRQFAQDLLRLGEDREGWDLISAVHELDGYDVTAFNLVTLRDQMARFQTLSNEHFIVRMAPLEAELYGAGAVRLLERARETLCRKYGQELEQPTVVEIFPEQKDFAVRTFGIPGNPGYLGVCFGSVITANSPASQAAHPANWEAVLWHEFCHVVTLNATRNRMPRWLSEGISVYEERQANPTWGQSMNLAYRAMILNGELKPVSELSGAFLAPKSPKHLQFAYYESSLAVEFLVNRYGLDALKRILHDLHDGGEINKAIAAQAAPLPEIEKQFAAFARKQAEQLAPGVDFDKPPAPASTRSRLPFSVPLPGRDDAAWEEAHPQNYYVRMQKAAELMKAKRWAEAKPGLESLVKSYHGEKGTDNPLWLLAVTERNLGDTEAERATLERLAGQEADFVDLFVRLIELAEAQKDWAAVARYAERLLAVDPLLSLPHRALAEAGVALGQNEQAIAAYRKLLLLDPPDPAEVHLQLARLLHGRGGSDTEAKRHVLQALEDAPRFREAQRLLLEIENTRSAETHASALSSTVESKP
jgi:tetratricopeptide (TPR) repeat protein